jgi:hypothetical protein
MRGQFLKLDTALPAWQALQHSSVLRIADVQTGKGNLQLGVGAVVEEMG